MENTLLSPLMDYIFSLIFGDQRNIDIVTAFLKTVLNIPEEEYGHLTIVNPFLKRIFKKDKSGIVDVRLNTRSGKVLHIELQVKKTQKMRNRIIYYFSKLFWEQLKSGEKWGKLNQVISIVICDHVLVPEETQYLNSYSLLNERTGNRFTDLLKVIILELPKLPREDEQDPVWAWMRFFKCKTEGEYDMLARKHPEVGKAVTVLKTLSWSERRRDIAYHKWLRKIDDETEKEELREEAQAEGRAEGLAEGRSEGLAEGLAKGRSEGLAEGEAKNQKALEEMERENAELRRRLQ
ncbi:MAG: Rpn family recombination-promoting nuclease/putative transposase [Treponema sp.]|jgi:predicted transposase/invertase (TIGR01784 family)|nr:Rpn family recombination-promoting nuclease/putative transposase [Treponema sp.]